MLSSSLCLLARGVIRDAETETISVFSIFENVTTEGFPFLIQELALLVFWHIDEEDPDVHQIEFRIFNNDDLLYEGEKRLDFDGTQTNRSITRINGLTVQNPGVLRFVLQEQDGDARAEYEITVRGPEPEVDEAE